MRARASSVNGRVRFPAIRFSASQAVGPALINNTRVIQDGAKRLGERLSDFRDGFGAIRLVEDGAGDDEPVDPRLARLRDRRSINPAVDLHPLIGTQAL